MRHRQGGRHLGRDTAHRKALYRNLITDLLRYERLTTTEAKAKEIRPMAERIITLGKRGDLHARRQALRVLYDKHVVEHVFEEIAPRMASRPGGYLRITSVEPRKGDGSRMATIELVDFNTPAAPAVPVATAPARRPRVATPAPAVQPPADDVIDATAGSHAATADEPVIGGDSAVDAAVDTTEEPTAEADETAEASDASTDDEEEGKDGAS